MAGQQVRVLVVVTQDHDIQEIKEEMDRQFRAHGMFPLFTIRHTSEGAKQLLCEQATQYAVFYDEVQGVRHCVRETVRSILIVQDALVNGKGVQDLASAYAGSILPRSKARGADIVELLLLDQPEKQEKRRLSRLQEEEALQLFQSDSAHLHEDFAWLTAYLDPEEQTHLRGSLPQYIREKLSNQLVKSVETTERGMYSVFGSMEFAAEAAYILAKLTQRRVLIIDGDRFNPSADVFLNVPAHAKKLKMKFGQPYASGLRLAYEAMGKNQLSKDLMERLCNKVDRVPLWVLTGAESIDDFEYYDRVRFEKLLHTARMGFDFVFVVTNQFIYDTFTCVALYEADRNLVPCVAQLDQVRKINRLLVFLEKKQGIAYQKHVFCAVDYQSKFDLPVDIMQDLFQKQLVGAIPYVAERAKRRNSRRSYMPRMKAKDIKGYLRVFWALGIPENKRLSRMYRKVLPYELG